MTITREYLDGVETAMYGKRHVPILIAALRRVLDLCDEREAAAPAEFRSIDFHGNPFPLLVAVDDVRAALAGTQTDDGAVWVDVPDDAPSYSTGWTQTDDGAGKEPADTAARIAEGTP